MPTVSQTISIVTRQLENGAFISEGVLLPETACYADTAARAIAAARTKVRRYLEHLIAFNLNPPPISASPEVFSVEFDLESPEWRVPVSLHYDAVHWTHGTEMAIAYVPALGIAILAENANLLEERVISHIRFALFRMNGENRLAQLVYTQRVIQIQVDQLAVKLNIKNPAIQLKRRSEGPETEEAHTLKSVAVDWTEMNLPETYAAAEQVRCVAEALTGGLGGSVLLVGPSGVGKTAVVHELVRTRTLYGLSGRRFYATSGSRLISGMGGYGMWQERLQNFCREAIHTRAVVHLGNIVELMEVGKSSGNTLGMVSFLRPFLQRGKLNAIAECTPEEIPFIERKDPHLLQAFQRIEITEPDSVRGRDILLSVAMEYAVGREERITLAAIDLLDRLHRRYATYSAYPGRPTRFMINLLRSAPDGVVVDTPQVLAAFSHETGIPMAILDETARLDLTATESWFENRVIGQPKAVRQVVDLLAVIKTRLARPHKPLASLLFAGPTGVGKTEMAKALSVWLFGDKERLIRFDMSEYAHQGGAARLIGGIESGEGQFTSKLREQPFSVVLLDEFEKADPETFDLLLQVLGEGRLTDLKGRIADFRNAVIIMTSNLGAASFQRGALGYGEVNENRGDAVEHFTDAVRKFLRPEMFNRIDAIIPFSSLSRETALDIARRELMLITQREGIALRGVEITLEDAVAGFLAERGFDPRYGARTLKRTAEEMIVAPLASRLNSYSEDISLSARVAADAEGCHVEVTAKKPALHGNASNLSDKVLQTLAAECATLRRQTYRLKNSEPILEVKNEIYQLTKLEKRVKSGKFTREKLFPEALRKLTDLRVLDHKVSELYGEAAGLEERFLLSFYQSEVLQIEPYQSELNRLRGGLDEMLLQAYLLRYKNLDNLLIAVFSEHREYLAKLAMAYLQFAQEIKGCEVTGRQIMVSHHAASGKRALVWSNVKDVQQFLADPPERAIGVVMAFQARMIYPLLCMEGGLHLFQEKRKTRSCLVQISEARLEEYIPPPGIEQPGGLEEAGVRRTYNLDISEIKEAHSKRPVSFVPDYLHIFFRETLRRQLLERARELIQEEGMD